MKFKQAHEDFVLTCGQGYLYSYILKKFKMKDLNDQPEHPVIKETITNWNNAHKLKVFNTVMDEVVKEIFIPFDFQVIYNCKKKVCKNNNIFLVLKVALITFLPNIVINII